MTVNARPGAQPHVMPMLGVHIAAPMQLTIMQLTVTAAWQAAVLSDLQQRRLNHAKLSRKAGQAQRGTDCGDSS